MAETAAFRVAFVVANEGVEQVELESPWQTVREEGWQAELLAPRAGSVRATRHLDHGDEFPVDRTLAEARAIDFDAVVLPGGVANPDRLRLDEEALTFLRAMSAAQKPAAAICHAPWTLINAGLVAGRTLTSWPSLAVDIRNAGGTWVDEAVHVCPNGPNLLVTSRKPADLPAFNRMLVETFRATGGRPADWEIDEAGAESFPASDPPAWNARAS
jgi:protease I